MLCVIMPLMHTQATKEIDLVFYTREKHLQRPTLARRHIVVQCCKGTHAKYLALTKM